MPTRSRRHNQAKHGQDSTLRTHDRGLNHGVHFNYFGWVLSVAVRFFFTFSLLGVALTLVKAWSLELAGDMTLITANLTIPIQIFIESILFLMMLIHVPTFAGRMLVGAVMPSVGVAGLSKSMAAGGEAIAGGGTAAAQVVASAARRELIDKLLLGT